MGLKLEVTTSGLPYMSNIFVKFQQIWGGGGSWWRGVV